MSQQHNKHKMAEPQSQCRNNRNRKSISSLLFQEEKKGKANILYLDLSWMRYHNFIHSTRIELSVKSRPR